MVSWRASIGARDLSTSFDCTVLDHHALGNSLEAGEAFCDVFSPVILLANGNDHPLSPSAFATLVKPMLGRALIEAIGRAVASRGTTT
ncbi:MAG: hypothetical protein ABI398_05215 [Devosia sp.]